MPRSRRTTASRGRAPIAVTLGDPRGIGPEIVAKAIKILGARDLVLVGDLKTFGGPLFRRGWHGGVAHGVEEPARGGVAFVECAHRLVTSGGARAMVTAPMRKLPDGTGHTELLSRLSGTRPGATLMMVTPRLKIALVTNHLPLSRVSRAITRERILLTLRRTDRALRDWFRVKRPRIGVLGLNPHAGEDGKLGREEIRVIRPALAAARRQGMSVEGPLPADSAFFHAVHARRWDAIVAMYHDQGLIPAKIEGFGQAVNVSLGLPYVRTSVDHGTAYDIAGKGIADPSSLIAAIRLARRLTMS